MFPVRLDSPVAAQEDHLEVVLSDYERRKQEETRRQVQSSLRLEAARKRGADYLRLYAVNAARDAAARLQTAGHKVMHQEMLDAYPPNIRVHFWPKPGPLDSGEAQRSTLELVWGDPDPDALCARRWSSDGPQIQGSAHPRDAEKAMPVLFSHDLKPPMGDTLDVLWVKEQLLLFVRETLEGS